jgi:hypothetical protein
MNATVPDTGQDKRSLGDGMSGAAHSQDELVLRIDGGQTPTTLANAIRGWANSALSRYPNGLVVMAGSPNLSEVMRNELLREVRSLVTDTGFPPDRVRCAAEAFPADLAEADVSAAPAVLLKVISARQAEMEVRSIAGMFSDFGSKGGTPCTGAS